jgi:EamA domain-containing membrane protein RarD
VTIGFIQFSAPTGQFLLSVVAFGNRPPNPLMWWGYAMIWTGVVIFVLELLTHANTQRKLKKRSIVTGTGEP